jgi:hypothetical protein
MIVSAGARESMQLSNTAMGMLACGARALLRKVIVVFAPPGAEALVALLHESQDVVRGQFLALRLGHCRGIGNPAQRCGTDERQPGYSQGRTQEAAAMHPKVGTYRIART